MTKPDDIPQSVWDEAGRVAKEMARKSMVDPLLPYYISAQPLVARAILSATQAEREACALVAESKATTIRLGGISAWHGASDIASAIRSR